jgi:SpoVK/Ycf46/Vps4 family AAA+-type ATPase
MRARKMAPSIVFIDDIDILAKRREIDMDGGSIYSRVLSTFLNEIDGIQTQKDVIVLACTSKLDKIDEALLRPGRIDTMIHVDNPSKEDAEELLLHFCRKENYPYEDASKAFPTTEHFSVADIRAFVKQKSIEKFLQEC